MIGGGFGSGAVRALDAPVALPGAARVAGFAARFPAASSFLPPTGLCAAVGFGAAGLAPLAWVVADFDAALTTGTPLRGAFASAVGLAFAAAFGGAFSAAFGAGFFDEEGLAMQSSRAARA
jgi:hypothetical protein